MRNAYSGEVEPIRTALVDLRRVFQRKELTALWGAEGLDYGDLRLLDAVGVAIARHGGATVGDVAVRLGIDPSRASRQVARAVARGLVVRRATQRDARKVVLEVTPRGIRLQAKGSALTRARIAHAIATWSVSDRRRFARLFTAFATAMVGSNSPGS
jgi:DNA-binding MarR family transcriptional regulator